MVLGEKQYKRGVKILDMWISEDIYDMEVTHKTLRVGKSCLQLEAQQSLWSSL